MRLLYLVLLLSFSSVHASFLEDVAYTSHDILYQKSFHLHYKPFEGLLREQQRNPHSFDDTPDNRRQHVLSFGAMGAFCLSMQRSWLRCSLSASGIGLGAESLNLHPDYRETAVGLVKSFTVSKYLDSVFTFSGMRYGTYHFGVTFAW